MPASPLRQLWASLHEPRAVTAVAVVYYVAMVAAGLAVIVTPTPLKPDSQDVFHALVGVLLIGAGAVGVPTAWIGAWVIERGAAIAAAIGGLLIVVEVLCATLWVAPVPHAHATLPFMLGSVAFWATRWLRIRQQVEAPAAEKLPTPGTD